MTTPLVSILIPAYNVERYITECLESVVNQTYNNLQIVVVDDGSKDNTGRIIDDYASRYPTIEVYHVPNGGVANARNILLSKVRGEFVLFVDSDDWIELDTVEILCKETIAHSLDITVCQKASGDVIPSRITAEKCEIWDKRTTIERFLEHKKINGALWNKFIRCELLQGVKFNPDVSFGEDALVIWETLKRADRIGLIGSRLYHHRLNESGISAEGYGTKMKSSHQVWAYFEQETKKLFPEFSELAQANSAVADFWLLYFAAIGGYEEDSDIREYRNHLRKELGSIRRRHLLPTPHCVVALCLSYSYRLTKPILKRLKTKTNK